MKAVLSTLARFGLVAGAALSTPAMAYTIDFEPLAGNAGSAPTVLQQGDFTLTYTPGAGGFYNIAAPAPCSPACASNGTNAFYSYNSGALTISLTAGGTFSLSQFDAAQTFTTTGRALNVLLTATSTGGPLSQNFTRAAGQADTFSTFAVANFSNLLTLTFSGVEPYPTTEFSLDNVVLDAGTPGVPEPATWAFLIVGFGLVGTTMRRRSTTVAFSAR